MNDKQMIHDLNCENTINAIKKLGAQIDGMNTRIYTSKNRELIKELKILGRIISNKKDNVVVHKDNGLDTSDPAYISYEPK